MPCASRRVKPPLLQETGPANIDSHKISDMVEIHDQDEHVTTVDCTVKSCSNKPEDESSTNAIVTHEADSAVGHTTGHQIDGKGEENKVQPTKSVKYGL